MARSPLPGLSIRRTEHGAAVVRIHYTADPDITPEWIAKERAKYTSQVWWDLEMEIKYEAKSGQLVYPEFDPFIHVVQPSEVPKRGCRFMSIDPHPRTPHAMLWLLIDCYSDWWIYRELWPSVFYGLPQNPNDDVEDNRFTIRDYAETVAYLEGNSIQWVNPATDRERGRYVRSSGGERIIYRFLDQAGKGFLANSDEQRQESYHERYERFGISVSDPVKSHKTGEDAIRDLLKLRNHDLKGTWPRIHISSDCRELIVQLQKHRYPRTASWLNNEKELKQEGVAARCHQIDNLRYLATGRLSYNKSLES